jgi:type I restriction enzyme S subunit
MPVIARGFEFLYVVISDISFLIGEKSKVNTKSSVFAFPSEEEQIKIANYLDNKTNQIDQIIKTIQSKITLQKEFRKTLINDVVTGKVKV